MPTAGTATRRRRPSMPSGAREVVARGYRALKFDPFGTAWQELSAEEMDGGRARVAAVREAVGPDVEIFIEVHGRLSGEAAHRHGPAAGKISPRLL